MIPTSLTAEAVAPLWEAVRARLEGSGLDNRGVVVVPELGADGRRTLRDLLDASRPVRRVDLGALETALRDLGVGPDLPTALAALGHPVSEEPALRRAARRTGREARAAARAAVESWPEPWAAAWIDEVVRAGVLRDRTRDDAIGLVHQVRRLLDHLDHLGRLDQAAADAEGRPERVGPGRRTRDGTEPGLARVDLAAQIVGDAHALDRGTRLEVALGRALAHALGLTDDDDPWEVAGIHRDLTSGSVLTWRLPLTGPLGAVCDAASAAGVPVHLSRLALDAGRIGVASGTSILVVENPRLVEAAAQAGLRAPILCANGSPSLAVQCLIDRLLDAGATLRYHGDLDVAGLVLCGRMHDRGVVPWAMTAADYAAAVSTADDEGITLPVDADPPPPTPWDPELATAFGELRLVVHEERLLPDLLIRWSAELE